jgi:hypothetical protein
MYRGVFVRATGGAHLLVEVVRAERAEVVVRQQQAPLQVEARPLAEDILEQFRPGLDRSKPL